MVGGGGGRLAGGWRRCARLAAFGLAGVGLRRCARLSATQRRLLSSWAKRRACCPVLLT